MGVFDGVLFLSDFDNTIYYTAGALNEGEACPEMPERNLAAIRRFMAEGGHFGVATGRATAAFRAYDPIVPTNTPAVVFNGGGIYNYKTGEYEDTLFLEENSRSRIAAVMEANREISLELFYPDDRLLVYHENRWNEQHSRLTGMGYTVVEDLSPEKKPWCEAKIPLKDGRRNLHVFVDGSIVEIYADEGRVAMSSLAFPKGDAYGVSVEADGAVEVSADGWTMEKA